MKKLNKLATQVLSTTLMVMGAFAIAVLSVLTFCVMFVVAIPCYWWHDRRRMRNGSSVLS